MANKVSLHAAIQVIGDGSSETVSFNLRTDPLSLFGPTGSTGAGNLNIDMTLATGVVNVSGTNYSSHSFNALTGAVTITLSEALTNGSEVEYGFDVEF